MRVGLRMIECRQIDRWAADAIGTRLEQQTSHSLHLFPLSTLNNPPQTAFSPFLSIHVLQKALKSSALLSISSYCTISLPVRVCKVYLAFATPTSIMTTSSEKQKTAASEQTASELPNGTAEGFENTYLKDLQKYVPSFNLFLSLYNCVLCFCRLSRECFLFLNYWRRMLIACPCYLQESSECHEETGQSHHLRTCPAHSTPLTYDPVASRMLPPKLMPLWQRTLENC